MKRVASTPGGTRVGEQSLAYTPKKLHKAWLFDIPAGATAGEAAELRKANGSPAAMLAERQKTEKYQIRLPSSLSLFAQSVRAFARAIPSRERLPASDRSD